MAVGTPQRRRDPPTEPLAAPDPERGRPRRLIGGNRLAQYATFPRGPGRFIHSTGLNPRKRVGAGITAPPFSAIIAEIRAHEVRG